MSTYRLDSIQMPDGNDYEIPIFIAEYGVTTYSEVWGAVTSGKFVFCEKDGDMYTYNGTDDGGVMFLHLDYWATNYEIVYCWDDDSWSNVTAPVKARSESSTSPSSNYCIALTAYGVAGTILRSSIRFGSSTNKYLAEDGTWQNIPSVPSPSSATPQALGTAAAGSSADYSRADHVHAKPTASEVGAIASPSSPSTGDFLVWNGTAWAAQSLSTWQGGNY